MSKLIQRLEQLEPLAEAERLRLLIEAEKARDQRVALAVTIIVAVIAAATAICIERQRRSAEFTLKAAEIVFSPDEPAAAVNRARALQELFPDDLPPDFADKLEKLYPPPARK